MVPILVLATPNAEAWAAIGTWGAVLVAAAAGTIALFHLRELRRTREEESRPYVVVYMEPTDATPQIIDLVIKNFGKTAAYDVHVRFDPPLRRSVQGQQAEDVWVFDQLPVLVPGQEWRTMWDFGPSRAQSDLPERYEASVTYRSSRRPLPPLKYVLDWSAYMGRRWVTTYNLHDAAKALREIQRTLGRWQEGVNGLAVWVRDGDARDADRQADIEEHRSNRQSVAGDSTPDPSGEVEGGAGRGSRASD